MIFWPLTNSDFPTNQTFHQFHNLDTELDPHRIMSGFHGEFATGVACQQGTLTLPDTWFRPPLWDLLVLQLLRPDSSKLPCLYSTFHLEYPIGTFSILLKQLLLWPTQFSAHSWSEKQEPAGSGESKLQWWYSLPKFCTCQKNQVVYWRPLRYWSYCALLDTMTWRHRRRSPTSPSCIDMKKAFNTVNCGFLLYKLQRIGVRGKFVKAIGSLYVNVRCSVRVNDDHTSWFDVTSSVKQGCVLSPTMFIHCGITIDDIMVSILLYADDIILFAPDSDRLQRMLNVVTEWCDRWKLQ